MSEDTMDKNIQTAISMLECIKESLSSNSNEVNNIALLGVAYFLSDSVAKNNGIESIKKD